MTLRKYQLIISSSDRTQINGGSGGGTGRRKRSVVTQFLIAGGEEGASWVYISIKMHGITHLKWMQFIVNYTSIKQKRKH